MALSVAQTVACPLLLKYVLSWKEAFIAQFDVVFGHLLKGT